MQDEQPKTSNAARSGASALEEYAALFGLDSRIEWQMETGEQMCLLAFLQKLRPECVIEVGTRFGGSMQVFSSYAKRVISCDIDPTCRERLGDKHPDAEFLVGPSQQTLPPLLAKLQQEAVPLSMLLIDGDHTAAGVQGDVHAMLGYQPACTLYVIMHDSFNPDVRRGIRTARWSENPYVHAVELDFITTGAMHFEKELYRQMWGGFALAVLKRERRSAPLEISAKKDHLFRKAYWRSSHTTPMRAVRKLVRMFGANCFTA
jgi:cephalosporin hydroxylase